LPADDVKWRCRAAPATEPVRATARSVSRAGNRAALIMKQILTFASERFTGLHDESGAAWTARDPPPAPRGRPTPPRKDEEPFHGAHAARRGVGSAHGEDAAVRADPAPDRSPPHPRGHDPAGLPVAGGREGEGPYALAHLRHP